MTSWTARGCRVIAIGFLLAMAAGCAGSSAQANPCTTVAWESEWEADPAVYGSRADRFTGAVWETDDYLFRQVQRATGGETVAPMLRWSGFQESHPNCFDGEGRQRWNGSPATGQSGGY